MAQQSNTLNKPLDAIALLKADHRTVNMLFQKYARTKPLKTKQKIAAQVFIALELHAQLEETVFYPAFAALADEAGTKLVEDALQEHQRVKDLIAELRDIDPEEDAGFDATFRELMQHVQYHNAEEEAEMLPEAEEVLEEQLEDLAGEMQELKQQLLAS
jgi:hemerythrin superfamily protein